MMSARPVATGARIGRRLRSRNGVQLLKFCLLVAIVIVVNLPIITMILNSLQSNQDLMVSSSAIPRHPTLENYVNLFSQTDFPTFFRNSLIVGGGSTLASVILAGFAGYALARFSNPFLKTYASGVLLLQMFPVILVLIPLFLIFKDLSLIDTYWSAILIYISGQLPFATWLYRGFFESIPRELEEAAWIDGCSRMGGFFRIVLRISAPGVAAVVILSFLLAWNDYLIASIFLNQQSLMTVPVGIQLFIQQYAAQWGSLMAASTMAMLPVIIFFMFVQRYMIQGMTAGAVKG
jgi:ABC-type glycerol-3-phosphate transport system permease component